MRLAALLFAPHPARISTVLQRNVSLAEAPSAPQSKQFPLAIAAGCVLLFWLAAVLLQVKGGAYRTELSGYPDEPSHYVTGLMIRDYVVSGFPKPPLAFATFYYGHFPKVAFGHWPPLFHFLEAWWMILFGGSRSSVMLLMALFTMASAIVIASWFAKVFGNITALGCGLLWVGLPIIQEQTSMVMAEMLFAAVTLSALYTLKLYIDKPDSVRAIEYGTLALASIMTKGNGWLLVPALFFALIFAKKLRMLLSSSMLVAAGMIAIAVPAQLLTFQSVVSALPQQLGFSYSAQSFAGFLITSVHVAGPVVLLLAVIGLVKDVLVPLTRGLAASSSAATMAGLLCGFFLLHCIVPAGVEARKLIVVLPAILYFGLTGATATLAALRLTSAAYSNSVGVLIIVISMILTGRLGPIPVKPGYGLASGLLSAENAALSPWLVSGTPTFEGAAVAEAAIRGNYDIHIVFRGFKVLAESDWNAFDYKLRYHSVGEMKTMLQRAPIELIAVETSPQGQAVRHNSLLIQALHTLPELWHPVPQKPNARCQIFLRMSPLSADVEKQLHEMLNLQKPAAPQNSL